MCRSDNSKASLPGSLPWRAEEPASLHPQPGQVAAAGNVVLLTVPPSRSAEKVAEEGEELVFSHNTA